MENTAMEKKYMAFISYSHADNREEGRKWADWLHHSLETYEIPKDLVGQKNSRGETIPEQIYPVFQDEKELSASSSLEGALKDALGNAENLIYLSSPASAKSIYVQDELKYFKQIGKADRMMALILAGEPEYGETCTDDQCFPEALRYKVDKDGNILKDQKEEPLAADVRIPGTRKQGFTSPEAFRRHLRAEGVPVNDIASRTESYRERLELAKLKIIAGVLAVPLGELTKRDKAYQLEKIKEKNRRMKRIAAAISALAVLAVIMGIFAWNQKNKAQKTLAHSLFASGIGKTTKGDVANGAAFIAEAIRNGDENARMYGASMLTARTTEYKIPYTSGGNTKFSADGRWLVTVAFLGDSKAYLQVWDVENNRTANTLRNVPLSVGWDFSLDKNSIIYFKGEDNQVYSWDHINNKLKTLYKVAPGEREPLNIEVSPDGNTMAIYFNDMLTYAFFDVKTMRQLGNDFKKADKNGYLTYYFPENGRNVVVTEGGGSLSKTPPVYNLVKILPDGSIQNSVFKTDFRLPKASFNKKGNLAALYGNDKCYIVDLIQRCSRGFCPVIHQFPAFISIRMTKPSPSKVILHNWWTSQPEMC